MSLRKRWTARCWTLRAMVLLVAARLLIAWVPFRIWRGWLGARGPHNSPGPSAAGEAHTAARQLAAHVERAAWRLPRAAKCLPRAIALSWLLNLARVPHCVVLAVRPPAHRGDGDDLHAWVEQGGTVILGDLPGPWLRLFEQG